jgi:hypothetical protein
MFYGVEKVQWVFHVIYVQSINMFDSVDTTIIRNTFSYIFVWTCNTLMAVSNYFLEQINVFLHFLQFFLFSTSDDFFFEKKKV